MIADCVLIRRSGSWRRDHVRCACVCAFHVALVCPFVGIQHTQCPCSFLIIAITRAEASGTVMAATVVRNALTPNWKPFMVDTGRKAVTAVVHPPPPCSSFAFVAAAAAGGAVRLFFSFVRLLTASAAGPRAITPRQPLWLTSNPSPRYRSRPSELAPFSCGCACCWFWC